jgi:hypothetical protein
MPVPADNVVADGPVAARDLEALWDSGPAGPQSLLQSLGGAPFPVVQPGVVQAHRGPGGELAR